MISIIVATSKNNIIGANNKLLWHIPEDLKRFKEITSGKTTIMGRKTFESLPYILPNRKHVILTRDKNFKVDSEMVEIIHSLDEILSTYSQSNNEVFVIGGGQIYESLLPFVNKLYLTKIQKDFIGDTKFPTINENEWNLEYASDEKIDPKSRLKFKFINFIK